MLAWLCFEYDPRADAQGRSIRDCGETRRAQYLGLWSGGEDALRDNA